MKKKQEEMFEQLQKKGLKGKGPKHIIKLFCYDIKIEYKGKSNYAKRSYYMEVKEMM